MTGNYEWSTELEVHPNGIVSQDNYEYTVTHVSGDSNSYEVHIEARHKQGEK